MGKLYRLGVPPCNGVLALQTRARKQPGQNGPK